MGPTSVGPKARGMSRRNRRGYMPGAAGVESAYKESDTADRESGASTNMIPTSEVGGGPANRVIDP